MPSIASKLHHHGYLATALDARAVAGPAPSGQDAIDADRLDFGAWLLPPADVGSGERFVRLASTVAGPVAVLVAVVLGCIAIG